MLSAREIAKRWGVTPRLVRRYCAEGRIPGAEKVGRDWILPDKAKRPRLKIGRPARD